MSMMIYYPKIYKKEKNEKLSIRISNEKSIINNSCPWTYRTFKKE